MCMPGPTPAPMGAPPATSPRGRARRRLLFVTVLLLLARPTPDASAIPLVQEPVLMDVETPHFRLQAPPELAEAMDACVSLVEPAYQSLAAALDSSLPQGMVIRIWTDADTRPGIDPTSSIVAGVTVPRLQPRQVLDLRLPVDRKGPALATAADEGLRLILAAQLLAVASEGRIPPGLQVGTARYLQEPGETTTVLVARLREALSAPPPTWSELNAAGAEYEEPLLHQAWSLSMAHYLLQSYGFGTFTRFLTELRRAEGWRSALSEVYGRDAAQMEAAWRAGLAAYTNGGWQEHLLYRIDLRRVTTRLEAGDYRGAAAQLRGAMGFLASRSADDAASAQNLLERAERAVLARGDLDLSLSLLDGGNYRQALAAAEAAAAPLAAVGDQAGVARARELTDRARLGVAAIVGLDRARSLPSWRSVQAVTLARRSAWQLTRLGDEVGALAAERWAHERSLPAAILGAVLAMAGAILIGANLVARKRSADPAT